MKASIRELTAPRSSRAKRTAAAEIPSSDVPDINPM
jgi:hypothetical protein